MKTKFYFLVFLLVIKILYSQNIGDYRSSASGDWTDYTKWQVYTATGWVVASQYPGQSSGNYSVTISDGHTISVGAYTNGNNNGPSLTASYNIGDLYVLGQLTLNINLELNNTSSLIIDAGAILWNQNNVYLKLKQNAEVNIINLGSGSCNSNNGINGYGFIGGSCSNNTSLIIGNLTYTNCAGGGNAIAGTFCNVNESGGTIHATPFVSPTSICYNPSQSSSNTVILTAPNNSNITETKTYTWYLDDFPVGFSGFLSQNSSTLTVNNLIPGSYTFRLKIEVTKSGNSYSAEGTVTVMVYLPISSGTINNINICSKFNTGNILTLSGHFGNIVKWQSSTDVNFLNNITDITNTQNTLSLPNNLTSDMYYRAVLSNGSCSGYSAVGYVKSNSTTYNGIWSNGDPDSTKKAIFLSNFNLSSDLSACAIVINNNAQVSIPAGKNFTVNGEVELISGNLIVESDANLKQINDNAINSGNITVKRKAKLKRLDYNYWGAPVSGQNVKAFSPNTLDTRFYVYNESNDYFDGLFVKNLYPNNTQSLTAIEDKNIYNYIKGKGYAIRAPNNYTTSYTNYDWAFNGIPNNGVINIPIQKNGNGFNLVANPYPSNISFNTFYSLNSSLIEPIIYFWTNVNPNPPVMQGSSYDGANYAIRNLTDGIPAQNQPVSEKPTDAIVIGQAFMVQKLNSGIANLTFNNSMRTTSSGRFFNSKLNIIESPKVWLKLTTPAQNYSIILIGYVYGATNGIDTGYDAESLAITSDMFYTIQDNKKLVIQGRDSAFNQNDIVSIGAKFFETGNYEISIAKVEGIFNDSQEIYLKDKLLSKTVKLSNTPYQFQAEAGEVNNRFEIIYTPENILAANEIKNQETLIYDFDKSIIIENKNQKIIEIQILDTSGRLVKSLMPNDNKVTLAKENFQKGVLIFNLKTKDKTTTKKFLVK